MSSQLLAGRRALQVIEMVGGKSGGVRFSNLSSELKLSSASLTRLLKVLTSEDWIRRDENSGKYFVGFRALQLAYNLRNQSPSIDIIAPEISDLSLKTGHSACFAAIRGHYFTVLAKTEQRKSYHFIDVFSPNFDWVSNAMGQFLLAYQPEEISDRIYERHFLAVVPQESRQLFSEIRQNNYFVRNDEFVTRIIAAVSIAPDGPVENLVAVAALTSEGIDADELLPIVQEHAAKIEARLKNQGVVTIY